MDSDFVNINAGVFSSGKKWMCKSDLCHPPRKEKVYISLLCGNSESNSKETWLAYESHEKNWMWPYYKRVLNMKIIR